MTRASVIALLVAWTLASSAGWCAEAAAGVSVRPVGRLLQARSHHSATLLRDGRVLACGGSTLGSWNALASCEIFDPRSERWSEGTELHLPRAGHAALRLEDDSVLLVGGHMTHYSAPTNTAELWQPETGTSRLVGPMATARSTGLRLHALDDGRVLVIGGTQDGIFGGSTDRIEAFDPRERRFVEWGHLVLSRKGFGVCRLSSTELAIVGGFDGGADPASGQRRRGSWELLNLETGQASLGGLLPRAFSGAGVELSPVPGRALIVSAGEERVLFGVPGDWEEIDTGFNVGDARSWAALSETAVLMPGVYEYRVLDLRSGKPLPLDAPLPVRGSAAVTPLGDGCALVSGGTIGRSIRATTETWMVCLTGEGESASR